jgi:hypothetical protein
MGATRKAFRTLVGRKISILENNIEMKVREIGFEDVKWVD